MNRDARLDCTQWLHCQSAELCPVETGNEGRRDRKCPQDVLSILYAQQMKGHNGEGFLLLGFPIL